MKSPLTRLLPSISRALLLGVLAAVAGCFCSDPVTGKRYFCLQGVSDEEEAKIGEQYAPSFIIESGGIYPEPEINRYLDDIVMEMARKSHRPDLPWEFHVLNTSQINAFALPGGQVFVTRGLLARLDSEAQFAHLMGHEIGHVTHRHALRGQGRSALIGILAGTVALVESQVVDEDDPLLVAGAVGATGQLVMLSYSRDQELESDERGVDYALQAGYDPREGKKTFEMFLEIKEKSGVKTSVISNLLSTHPLDETRIERIGDYIDEEYPDLPGSQLEVTNDTWKGHLTRIKWQQKYYEDHDRALALVSEARERGNQATLDEAEALLRAGREALPNHAPFHVGLGIVAFERSDFAAANRYFEDALRHDGDSFNALLYTGLIRFRQDDLSGAQDFLTRAHNLHEVSALPCYFLAQVHEAREEWNPAIEWYEKTNQRSMRGSDLRERSSAKIEELKQKNSG